MNYIEALDEYTPVQGEKSLFLAGGITECDNWQPRVSAWLNWACPNLVILNPRRKNFPIDDPLAAEEQIKWEYRHLRTATAILFWFPEETLCPITLFEYGKWLGSLDIVTANDRIQVVRKKLFVGCHDNYKRKSDVIIQTALERPGQIVHTSLSHAVKEVEEWYAKTNPN